MKHLFLALLTLALTHCTFAQQWLKIDSVFNLSGVAVQNFSAPEFADLNHDGYADLLLGNGSASPPDYFENGGALLPPKFVRNSSVLAPIYSGGMAGKNSDYPAICDLDGDGCADLIIGGFNGLLYYRNIGDPGVPQWQLIDTVFTTVNPLIGTDAKPAFADLDGDGDLDLVVGIGESFFGGVAAGVTLGFRNNGSLNAPHFAQDSTLVTGIPDVGLNSFPTLKDIDGDGDFDLLIGRDLAPLVYFTNTGTRANPVWTQNASLFAPVEATTYWKNPTLSDIDRDGDPDLIYGTSDGTLYFYENVGTSTSPKFQYNTLYFAVTRIAGNASTASLADFDNDGDVDLLSGDWLGRFQYFRNDGASSAPKFTNVTTNFTSIDAGSYSSPVFVDIDRDGDLDIVSGALDGKVYCYINTGSTFTQNTTLFGTVDIGWRSTPGFADLDSDGDPDMLVGAEDAAAMQFYRNDGTSGFVPDNSFITGVTSVGDGHPAFVDLDKDGDSDLVIGGIGGHLLYYENIGTPRSPAWRRNDARVSDIAVHQDAAPSFADLNGDGIPDVIIGEYNGNFSFYKNALPTSVRNDDPLPTTPVLEQNYPNPFNPSTKIGFRVRDLGLVSLKVYDVLGREVATLVNEMRKAGTYTVEFDSRPPGGEGSRLSSGVYLYQLKAGNFVATRKLLLLR